jgi:molecular chaperone DnaK
MQTSVTIHVFQGERPMASDNVSLGEFNLDGLAPAPRGMPKIEVTFDIDANGILSASARDTATGKSQSIRITGSTRLAEDEKKRMINDAERYAEDDRKRREQAEKLNAADAMCYEAEKVLAEFSSKLTEDLRRRLDAALRETREALRKKDAALAAERAEALRAVLKEAGAVIYAQAPGAPKQGPYAEYKWPGGTTGGSADAAEGQRARVVDAEYKETK